MMNIIPCQYVSIKEVCSEVVTQAILHHSNLYWGNVDICLFSRKNILDQINRLVNNELIDYEDAEKSLYVLHELPANVYIQLPWKSWDWDSKG